MSIKDMVADIEQDTREEIEASKNRAKAESTKTLMDKAEQLENLYKDKKDKLEIRLQRKEQTLKAEKDFAYRSMALVSEDKFAQNLVPFVREGLLAFPINHPKEYRDVFSSWLEQAAESLDGGSLRLRLNPRDKDIAAGRKNITLTEDPSIEAGFILSGGNGVYIDLSFGTLFAESQVRLQSSVMNFLKEATR